MVAAFDLTGPSDLEELDIRGNRLDTLGTIPSVEKLKRVYLDNNYILDFTQLYGKQYEEITAENNSSRYDPPVE